MSPDGSGLTPDRDQGEPPCQSPGDARHGVAGQGARAEVGESPTGVDRPHPAGRGLADPGPPPAPTADGGSLFDNGTRERIRDLLIRMPGTNKNQIARRLDLHPSLRDYHLKKLLREDLVVTRSSVRGREILCFWWEDADLWNDLRTRVLYGRRASRLVALYIADHPGATTAEIGGALDRSGATIRYHLGTLGGRSLVERERDGRRIHYRPAGHLVSWVEDVGEGFPRPWRD